MNEFDITLAYPAGNHVILHGKEYVYDPKDERYSFSVGVLPTEGKGWKPYKRDKRTYSFKLLCDSLKLCNEMFEDYDLAIKGHEPYMTRKGWIDSNDPLYTGFTLFYINSEPNEPTVLDCKDKMMKE